MFTIKFADHNITVDNKYPYVERLCRDYITDENPEFTVKVTDAEIQAENKDGGHWSADYLESLAVYRKICECLLDEDVILFHCSALAIDGKAVLFTAPSGTGKSTHTRLWREHFGDQVVMVNDDKPLLHIGDTITVYGTAYGGKDNLQTNTKAEVSAIIILHQAAENDIIELSPQKAFPTLLNQTYRNETADGMIKTLGLVDGLSKLPIFSLGCNISDEAVMTVYNELKGRNIL